MAKFRVLIVDDNREIRHMFAEGIKTLGADFDVLEVPSAEEALLISSGLHLDLVVADVRLPGMSGLDLVSRLQKRSPDMKTMLVTGVEEPRLRRQVAEAGATAFFYKPVELADFLDAVERCLGLVKNAFPLPSVAEEPVATSVKPGLSGAAPGPSFTLAERLSALRQELGAASTVVLDDNGQVLAEAGDLPEIHTDVALHSALMTTLSASLKISHALGTEIPDDMLFFRGLSHHLCLAHIGMAYALIIAVKEAFTPESIGVLRRAVPPALRDLQSVLEFAGAEALPIPREEPIAARTEIVPEMVDPSIQAEVDALFAKVSKEQIEQADDFWNAILEQSELDGVSNADALSYDQARQLGLAPEEK